MSKVDALRAMREARYAQQTAGAPAPKRAKPVEAKPVKQAAKVAEPVSDELCGHRNMSGRTCTRERGHSAKSHRYS